MTISNPEATIPDLTPSDMETITDFHRLLYRRATHEDLQWRGVPVCKLPQDLLHYQEVITRARPTLILEMGTFMGGSALFLADCLTINNIRGKVVTFDPFYDQNWAAWKHQYPDTRRLTLPNVYQVARSSIEAETVSWFQGVHRPSPDDRIMLILDSQHERAHVLRELELWSHLVTPGQYLVVEDTNINGHPVRSDLDTINPEVGKIVSDGGPWEALEQWISEGDLGNQWSVESRIPMKHLISYNTWLRRV